MTTISKDTILFADSLVKHYAQYDVLDNQYVLRIDNIPLFDLYKLTALIMRNDLDVCIELCGFDNPSFEKQMLPNLIRLMFNSTDHDNQIEFVSSWKEGAYQYCKAIVEKILIEQLQNYNHDLAA